VDRLPDEQRAKRATCEHFNHETYEDGNEVGEGFYWVCRDCGYVRVPPKPNAGLREARRLIEESKERDG
jgi:uncharacterized OB-fold protein